MRILYPFCILFRGAAVVFECTIDEAEAEKGRSGRSLCSAAFERTTNAKTQPMASINPTPRDVPQPFARILVLYPFCILSCAPAVVFECIFEEMKAEMRCTEATYLPQPSSDR